MTDGEFEIFMCGYVLIIWPITILADKLPLTISYAVALRLRW